MSAVSAIQELLYHPGLSDNIRIWVKRDDLLHPLISGNKWRKLAPLLQRTGAMDKKGVLSFGGPFSNHLHALAAAGKEFGFATAAVVRGTATDVDNPTLAFARRCGMSIHPVPKKVYDAGTDHSQITDILSQYQDFEILPEGGSTSEAVESCKAISEEILQQIPFETGVPFYVCVPAGTGCTAAGVIAGLHGRAHTIVFPATATGFSFDYLKRLGVEESSAFSIEPRFDFGGFAKMQPELIGFIRTFHAQEGILLDPLYTGKMLFGIYQMMLEGTFPAASRIVVIHTGGLQGWDGFLSRYGISGEWLVR